MYGAMGSVHYISPEQARGGYCDERSDIYSLGITMYEMITGRVPFNGDSTVAVALAHINETMTPPSQYVPGLPVALEQIIFKCTQKKQDRRYASCSELISDLRQALITPNENFVKEVPLMNTNPTVMISDGEVTKIRQESREMEDLPVTEEASGQMGQEADEDIPITWMMMTNIWIPITESSMMTVMRKKRKRETRLTG